MQQGNAKKVVKKIIYLIIELLLVGVIIFCGVKLFEYYKENKNQSEMDKEMVEFKPQIPDEIPVSPGEGTPSTNDILKAAQEKNADIVGWLTVPNTKIDYPFVQAKNNDYYLRRNINHKYALAGTLFMDYRSAKDFSGFINLIYGHNMKNNTMFSDITRYSKADYFESNNRGWLFLPEKTYRLEIFAYMTVDENDKIIYNQSPQSEKQREQTLDYIKNNAKQYRDIGVTIDDRLVLFSTCTDANDTNRQILYAKINELNI